MTTKYQDQWAYIQDKKNKLDKTEKTITFTGAGYVSETDKVYPIGVVFERPANNDDEFEFMEEYKDEKYLDNIVTKKGDIRMTERKRLAKICGVSVDSYWSHCLYGVRAHGFTAPIELTTEQQRILNEKKETLQLKIKKTLELHYKPTTTVTFDMWWNNLLTSPKIYVINLDEEEDPDGPLPEQTYDKFNVELVGPMMILSKKK
jgi:hypothetical protein